MTWRSRIQIAVAGLIAIGTLFWLSTVLMDTGLLTRPANTGLFAWLGKGDKERPSKIELHSVAIGMEREKSKQLERERDQLKAANARLETDKTRLELDLESAKLLRDIYLREALSPRAHYPPPAARTALPPEPPPPPPTLDVKAVLANTTDCPVPKEAPGSPVILRIQPSEFLPHADPREITARECVAVGTCTGEKTPSRIRVHATTVSCFNGPGGGWTQPIRGDVIGKDGKAEIHNQREDAVGRKEPASLSNRVVQSALDTVIQFEKDGAPLPAKVRQALDASLAEAQRFYKRQSKPVSVVEIQAGLEATLKIEKGIESWHLILLTADFSKAARPLTEEEELEMQRRPRRPY